MSTIKNEKEINKISENNNNNNNNNNNDTNDNYNNTNNNDNNIYNTPAISDITLQPDTHLSDVVMNEEVSIDKLTPEEKCLILKVLCRDEEMRKKEEERICQIKKEIRNLRAKGLADFSLEPEKTCNRCHVTYGWFFNRPEVCLKCHLKICKKCRIVLGGSKIFCLVCLEIMDLERKSGLWFYSNYPRNKRKGVSMDTINIATILKSSLYDQNNDSQKKKAIIKPQKKQPTPEPKNTKVPIVFKKPKKDYGNINGEEKILSNVLEFVEEEDENIDIHDIPEVSMNYNQDAINYGDQLWNKDQSSEVFNPTISPPNLNQKLSGSLGSLASIYSGAGEIHYGKVLVSGDIELSCKFDEMEGKLMINVVRCRDLGIADFKKKTSNPYVKCFLLPDKQLGRKKTSIKKKTLNPLYNETLMFKLPIGISLESKTLLVIVSHSERLGRNDFLGEVHVELKNSNLERLKNPSWFRLNNRQRNPQNTLSYFGDLDIGLKYVSRENLDFHYNSSSGNGELQILIKEARNLSSDKSAKLDGSFCKAVLVHGHSKQIKQKSEIIKPSGLHFRWNHTFIFTNISRKELIDCSLELTFWEKDKDRINSNIFLGGVRLNSGEGKVTGDKKAEWMDARGDEVLLWMMMLDRPDLWIDGTIYLRAAMTSRKK